MSTKQYEQGRESKEGSNPPLTDTVRSSVTKKCSGLEFEDTDMTETSSSVKHAKTAFTYTPRVNTPDNRDHVNSNSLCASKPFIRRTNIWDYQPPVCKDYKETAYCVFGDTCKFLHDRGDYKHGWEQEEDLGSLRRGNEKTDVNLHEICADDSKTSWGTPDTCFICLERFKNPVVTKCKHLFCERCAADYYKKSTRCYVCGSQTMGVFNSATRLMHRNKKKNTTA